jgi:Ser-tRNA(Ala) deacylase AlaX
MQKFGKLQSAGLQLGINGSREDVKPLHKLSEDELKKLETKVNEIIGRNYPVNLQFLERAKAEEYLKKYGSDLSYLPSTVKKVRIVEINEFDAWACGGTHVRSTGEVGVVRLLKCKKVGKDTVRIYFKITDK